MLKSNSVYACDVMEGMVSGKTAKMGIHKVRSIIDQQYVGDINVMPARGFENLKHLLSNPTLESIESLITTAERATWGQLELIERSTRISKTFQSYLKNLREQEQERLHFEHKMRVGER
jgi:hypothetical protein